MDSIEEEYIDNCPFCHSVPSVFEYKNSKVPTPIYYEVACTNLSCFAQPRVRQYSRAAAIEKWNYRRKKNTTYTPLDKVSVKKYLDDCINYWRKEKNNGCNYAEYYIDAFQSIRVSLLKELLSKDK